MATLQSKKVSAHTTFTGNENTFALVGICVGKAWCLARHASKETPEIGSDLVLAILLNSVALGTLLHKDLLSLFNVTHSGLKEKIKEC